VEVAERIGVHHVVRFRRRKGLAAAFMAGIDACVKLGADFIVNTDGDNQYAASDIPKLLDPLLAGEADIVIGDRNIRGWSTCRWRGSGCSSSQLGGAPGLQHPGPDTTSGFRAYTREARCA